jgi:hypothetical protein
MFPHWLAGLLALAAAWGDAPVLPVDRVAAVVGDAVVLASDVALEAALDPLDQSPLPGWSAREPDALQRVIDRTVMGLAAQGLPLFQPDAAEVSARFERVRLRFRTAAAFAAWLDGLGLTEEAVRGALRARLVAERWLRQQVPIDEDVAGLAGRLDARIDALVSAATVRRSPTR